VSIFLKTIVISCQFKVFPGDKKAYDDALSNYLSKRLEFQDQYERRHTKKIPLKPKNIWMLHAGRLAKDMGSLSQVDTQFGEQKNAQIKQFSQRSGQAKNVLETVANREKCFMAVNEIHKNSRGQPTSPFVLQNSSDKIREAVQSTISVPSNFSFFKNLELFDSIFKSNFRCGVLHGDPRNPKLGIIAAVAVHKPTQQYFFVLQDTKTFSVKRLDILRIEICNSFLLLKSTEIVLAKPVNIYERKNHSGYNQFYSASYF
jgi:hypothetical protein